MQTPQQIAQVPSQFLLITLAELNNEDHAFAKAGSLFVNKDRQCFLNLQAPTFPRQGADILVERILDEFYVTAKTNVLWTPTDLPKKLP